MPHGQSTADQIKEQELRLPLGEMGQFKQLPQNDPTVAYMTSDKGPFMCNRCQYFNEPNSCQKVEGEIDPAGCCNLFEPMTTNETSELTQEGASY